MVFDSLLLPYLLVYSIFSANVVNMTQVYNVCVFLVFYGSVFCESYSLGRVFVSALSISGILRYVRFSILSKNRFTDTFFFLIFITIFCAVTFTVISTERLIVIIIRPKGIGDISAIMPTSNMIMQSVEIIIRTAGSWF